MNDISIEEMDTIGRMVAESIEAYEESNQRDEAARHTAVTLLQKMDELGFQRDTLITAYEQELLGMWEDSTL